MDSVVVAMATTEGGGCNDNMSKNNILITSGCAVLLDINNGDKFTFAHLNKNASVKIGNMKCWLDSLIGHPYGAVFEVQSGPKGPSFVRIPHSAADVMGKESTKDDGEAEEDEDTKCKDNRTLVDNNTAQTLSAEDISKMRSEGVSGKAIVDALVANSATFHTKTAFSQEKYLRKKQKKYAPRVVVRRPSARSVCEAYFVKDPNKIGFLRTDMLALILSLANVGAYAEVLVLDMLGGLLTVSVAERLGGHGSVCSTYSSSKPENIDMVRLFNFDATTASRLVRAPVSQLVAARAAHAKQLPEVKLPETNADAGKLSIPVQTPDILSMVQPMEEERPMDNTSVSNIETEVSSKTETQVVIVESEEAKTSTRITQVTETVVTTATIGIEAGPESEHVAKRRAGRMEDEAGKTLKAGRPASEEDVKIWGTEGFTSLIVGAPYVDPSTVVEKLLPLLAPSAPFVIYHPYLQPLGECMHKLQSEGTTVALQLQEPWLREYQVLPSRTHPNMQMSSTGGWVLSGIYIGKPTK